MRSVSGLKRQLMDARARKDAAAAAAAGEDGPVDETGAPLAAAEPVEWNRIFSEEDFERIRCCGVALLDGRDSYC